MVLSIGSTPLIRMPFRAAPIHIRPSSLKHFISSPFVASNSVCRRRCSVLTRTQRQASMGQHVESSVLSLVKHQTLCDPRGDPRGAQTQPNFAMSRQSFWVHVQVDQIRWLAVHSNSSNSVSCLCLYLSSGSLLSIARVP